MSASSAATGYARSRRLAVPGAWAIKRLAADNAAAIGLNDRGVLKVGMKADINILDYDNMRLRSPEVVYDLPAGGKRLVQRTDDSMRRSCRVPWCTGAASRPRRCRGGWFAARARPRAPRHVNITAACRGRLSTPVD